jgi:hypothetical protein
MYRYFAAAQIPSFRKGGNKWIQYYSSLFLLTPYHPYLINCGQNIEVKQETFHEKIIITNNLFNNFLAEHLRLWR